MTEVKNSFNMDLAELEGLLDLANSKVPSLITNLLKTIYSEEAGANIGKAVGALYKELIAAGISQELASKMASDYMFSLKDVTKNVDVKSETNE
ncbi:hypothetical protein [Brevibacillus daliensis]|uniref:hypothetical protein n=1 Tax=Brevibacillus daliensis TaxID=2892995 RepID=UPI001E63739C|nr:hypothetical protein [Brevibacillus daliensis]